MFLNIVFVIVNDSIWFHWFDSSFPYKGFRLNRPSFSGHHMEGEMLLMSGTELVVMNVEEVEVNEKLP